MKFLWSSCAPKFPIEKIEEETCSSGSFYAADFLFIKNKEFLNGFGIHES